MVKNFLTWMLTIQYYTLFDNTLGPDCGIDYDECKAESPCQNDATCLNYEGGYNCSCTEGYKGKNCTEVDCASVVCLNGGQCNHTQDDSKWLCDCPKYVHGESNLLHLSISESVIPVLVVNSDLSIILSSKKRYVIDYLCDCSDFQAFYFLLLQLLTF